MHSIAFDLWETLLTNSPEATRAQQSLRLERLGRALHRYGYAVSSEALETAYKQIWTRCQELYWSRDRDIPTRQQIVHLVEALDLDRAVSSTEMDELEEIYSGTALEILPTPVEGSVATLRILKERGYRIGLISNTGRTPGSVLRLILQACGLSPMIDAMVFSNEHGACKPQLSIFQQLADLLGSSPAQTAFVGDNPYCDVYGAQQAGMKGVLFVPSLRGVAVGPPIDHQLTIEPDATVRELIEIPPLLERVAW